MGTLPIRLNALLEKGLEAIQDKDQQTELRLVARALAAAAWQHWLAWRPPEDNRPEHEWVVFANVMKIAESENLSVAEKRIAAAFSFLHDTFFIPRITEAMIRKIEGDIPGADAEHARELQDQVAQLRQSKAQQRQAHMEGGARNAAFILGQIKQPDRPNEYLFTGPEIERCVEIISKHDGWKMGQPHPSGSDRLAVACFEGDALWPLHPLGILADLERPDQNDNIQDFADPHVWQGQVQENLKTLLEYRANWANYPGEAFIDAESIFRTRAGHDLYCAWRKRWNSA
jgi:hypothetical protein